MTPIKEFAPPGTSSHESPEAREPSGISSGTPEGEALLALIARGTPFIDVRSPIEFSRGSIPGALNLPVLDDEQRAAVGTSYKVKGSDLAINLAKELVSGEDLAEKMRAWRGFASRHPDAWIYCFRGGLRSKSVQQALADTGVNLPLIPGGYKRLRQLLIDVINHFCRYDHFAVISGLTGCGKTAFLHEVATRARVIDLEGLAHHRGSAFGKQSSPQPTQIDFENHLAASLLRTRSSDRTPILVEDESRTIGRIVLPRPLYECLSRSPLYIIEKPIEDRARFLISTYLFENYAIVDGVKDPEKISSVRQDLHRNFDTLQRALGGQDVAHFKAAVDSALQFQSQTGKVEVHLEWVKKLLARYYDPLYERHIAKHSHRIIARGTTAEIYEQLMAHK